MLPAVTADRVRAVLDAEGFKYQFDEDNSKFVVHFTELVAVVVISDRLFSIQTLWRGDFVTDEDIEKSHLVCNSINSRFSFPKVYPVPPKQDVSGSIAMEFQMPVEDGVTDDQLEAFFNCGMRACFMAEEEIAESFPHLVTWSEEEE